jgi:sugar/nucleoside kinase (ribokinase family)
MISPNATTHSNHPSKPAGKMPPLQIVGIGMATLDVLVRLDQMPTWDGGLTRYRGFGLDGGGPVGTAMVAAARLGASVGFIGTAGNDTAAELKMRFFRDDGVDLGRMVYRDAPDDQVFFCYVHAETGERVFSGPHRVGESALGVGELDCEYITSAQYLHLDGFHFAAALQAAQWAQGAGRTVVLDGHQTKGPVEQHVRELIAHVDVLICGSGFAQGLTGSADPWQAREDVLKMGPRICVQTEGEDGSYTVTADERFHTPAFEVDVIDTTGAGDVFHGAYIVGLLNGWDLQTITQFSTAVSAIKCTSLGGRAGIPRFDDVIEFLKSRGIHIDPQCTVK